jgi:hypothetical protein
LREENRYLLENCQRIEQSKDRTPEDEVFYNMSVEELEDLVDN